MLFKRREHVKQRFYRSASADFSGSGFGLSILKRIAELHGGALDIIPAAAGNGVTLLVSLPLGAAAPAAPPDDPGRGGTEPELRA